MASSTKFKLWRKNFFHSSTARMDVHIDHVLFRLLEWCSNIQNFTLFMAIHAKHLQGLVWCFAKTPALLQLLQYHVNLPIFFFLSLCYSCQSMQLVLLLKSLVISSWKHVTKKKGITISSRYAPHQTHNWKTETAMKRKLAWSFSWVVWLCYI